MDKKNLTSDFLFYSIFPGLEDHLSIPHMPRTTQFVFCKNQTFSLKFIFENNVCMYIAQNSSSAEEYTEKSEVHQVPFPRDIITSTYCYQHKAVVYRGAQPHSVQCLFGERSLLVNWTSTYNGSLRNHVTSYKEHNLFR